MVIITQAYIIIKEVVSIESTCHVSRVIVTINDGNNDICLLCEVDARQVIEVFAYSYNKRLKGYYLDEWNIPTFINLLDVNSDKITVQYFSHIVKKKFNLLTTKNIIEYLHSKLK